MSADPSKRLVVFVHGRGGDAGTWGQFPDLLRSDAEVSRHFEIADPYEYRTNLAGMGPGIDDLALRLEHYLGLPRFERFSSIVILAHSMGGLVARRMVLNALQAQRPVRTRCILTFATPHLGSALSPRVSQQDRDLAIGSDFMTRLGRDWAAADADRHVEVRHVVAGGDGVVGEWSATAGFRRPRYHYVADADHRSLVKPANTEAAAFQWAKAFLLESRRPGHQAVDRAHYEQPLLRMPLLANSSLDRSNNSRLIFGARAVPFFGREQEWERLQRFLEDNEPFAWLVVQAPGGAGKSRLALELCLSHRDAWYCGFLPKEEMARDWLRWQPLAPTLVVLDYATKHVDLARAMLHALASRTQPEAPYPLPFPVRVLLLVRDSDERALREDIVERGDAVQALRGTGSVGGPLRLSGMADPWPIFEAVFRAANRSLPARELALEALRRIDPQARPLFSLMLADALTASGEGQTNLQLIDAQRLKEDVIDRWRAQFWRPACEAAGLGNGRAEETLLALATLCGGLPLKDGCVPELAVRHVLPTWNPHVHPQVLAVMAGRRADEAVVPALEPDLVGEHFVLSEWAKRSRPQQQALLAAAWRSNEFGCAAFLDRLSQNLPLDSISRDLAVGLLFQATPAEGRLGWAMLGVNLLGRLGAAFPSETDRLLLEMAGAAKAQGEAALWWSWAQGAVNVLRDLRSRDPKAARELLEEIGEVAQARGESAIWQEWAKGVVNVLIDLRSRDPKAARKLLDEIAGAARARDETALWEAWAKGAVNVLVDLRSRGPKTARELLDEIAEVARARDEAALWEAWAKGAFNVLDDLRSRDPKAARELLDEMAGAARARGEAALWELWAKGAFNVLNDLMSRDPKGARELLDEMAEVAQARGEAALWEVWAEGVVNVLVDLRSRDPKAARELLDDIAKVARERDEAALWKVWAQGAVNLLRDLGSRDPKAARALLDEMAEVARVRGETALWQEWAKGAVNVLTDLGSRDPKAARALLDEMAEAAGVRGEAALWEVWAKGACNLLHALTSRDPKAARELLGEMAAAARSRGEAALWREWAKGALNLLHDLKSRDPKAARALLDELVESAGAHGEAALWEWWSRGTFNMLRDLGRPDPKTVQELLDQMAEAARARGGAALWEAWAKGRFNLLDDLRSLDPKAARELLDDMAETLSGSTRRGDVGVPGEDDLQR